MSREEPKGHRAIMKTISHDTVTASCALDRLIAERNKHTAHGGYAIELTPQGPRPCAALQTLMGLYSLELVECKAARSLGWWKLRPRDWSYLEPELFSISSLTTMPDVIEGVIRWNRSL
jgi:hypothetical protein